MTENKLSNSSPKMHSNAEVKHQNLNDLWTLWYLHNDRKKIWDQMQNIVRSFDTVDDFWSVYNNIRNPSELNQGNDYSTFKNNIRAMKTSYEDVANRNGGQWILNVPKRYRRSKLDDLWLNASLGIMRESFEYHNEINGCVVKIRHAGDVIAIWTSDAEREKSVLAIGLKVKEYLRLDSDFQLSYKSHSCDKNKKPKYTYKL